MKVIFAFFVWGLLLFLAIMGGIMVFGFFGISWVGLLLGFAVWCILMAYIHRFFLASVPEVTGLVLVNAITGKMRGIGTGLYFRWPWEQIKIGNYINLRVVTKSRPETYPSKDGPLMKVEWSYQYVPRVEDLPRYIAVDETTIDKGIGDVGSSFLGTRIAATEAIKCKLEQEVIGEELQSVFERAKIKTTEGDLSVEKFYGIDLVRLSLSDLDFEEEFQEARVSEQVAERLREIAKKIREENPTIPEKDAMNMALIINKKVTKHIQEVEGKGGDALASLLVSMFRGAGADAKSTTRPQERRQERRR